MGNILYKLVFYNNNKVVKKIAVKDNFSGVVTIGRDSFSDVLLENNEVSKLHAQIIIEKGKLKLVDLESTNGSFIKSNKLIPNTQINIKVGDKIFFSNSNTSYLEIEKQNKLNLEPKGNLVQTDLLSLINKKDRVSIGRNEECDLVLYHPQISRRHCEIIKDQNGVLILKDYSRNGTFVNGKKIHNSHKIISKN